uniref:Uncharacterized protein n=1 Tax=Oryza rufipogon TaxID=4529 RepID=A0A0E0NKH5_ORYRU
MNCSKAIPLNLLEDWSTPQAVNKTKSNRPFELRNLFLAGAVRAYGVGEEGGFCGVESCAQASLPDSFLADLDELSDNEAYPMKRQEIWKKMVMVACLAVNFLITMILTVPQSFIRLNKIEDALHRGTSILPEDLEHQLIADSNALLVDIDNEITIIYNFIREKY